MTRVVEVPLWLFVLILLFAAVTFASHFLVPSVRWFLRRRMERAVERLNRRLARPIAPFKIARRHDMIERLVYDPAVTRIATETARAEGIPENVAFETARRYAREIVPAFSATLYFGWGARLARWLSRTLYRVRIDEDDLRRLGGLPREAPVVFVINHRSNMDYVLVTWLVSGQAALSYAVGEWARVWPLSGLVRMMGAYFIRRRNHTPLYRRVLARYVQMATEGGVTQAIFPEGALSLDGRLGTPRLGLLSYIAEGVRERGSDVVFVPVALNYDRIIEDRFLVRAAQTGTRRFRPTAGEVAGGLGRLLRARLTGRFRGFGTVRVALGETLSLRAFDAARPEAGIEALAEELMARIARIIPVLPVPLVARQILRAPASTSEIEQGIARDLALLRERGAVLPRRDAGTLTREALTLLAGRAMIAEGPEGWAVRPGQEALLGFYAGSVAHLFEGCPVRDPAPA